MVFYKAMRATLHSMTIREIKCLLTDSAARFLWSRKVRSINSLLTYYLFRIWDSAPRSGSPIQQPELHWAEPIEQGWFFAQGYGDLDDILLELSKTLQDPYLSLMKSYLGNVEFKNTDKVFYSPLVGALPPFLRYAKRFDSFGIIEKFNKELQSIDTHCSGFVPVNLFRSILEHELKIKEKIVLDFIQNMRETDASQNL